MVRCGVKGRKSVGSRPASRKEERTRPAKLGSVRQRGDNGIRSLDNYCVCMCACVCNHTISAHM